MKLTRNLLSGYNNPAVDAYVYSLLPRSEPVLREMEAFAAKDSVPIIGPAVGRLLALLVQITGARRIFEMGSAIGYSTIWLARAAGPRAQVFYSDGDPERAARASNYFRRAGVAGRIQVRTGISQRILRQTSGTFDMIFIDVDKHQYPEALRVALPKLRRGGLLVVDNVLWSGRVARAVRKGDANTRGIRAMNRAAYANKQLYPVIVPLRDGVLVARKG